MASSLNLKIVSGNIGFIQVKNTPSGTKIASFSVATEDGIGEKKKTTWHNCKAFNKTADLVERFCEKGTLVIVQGREEYDKVPDGKGVYATTIVDRIQFMARLKAKDGASAPPDLGGDGDDMPPDLEGDVPF